MSGGYFDHQDFRIEEIAIEIKRLIVNNEEKDEWGHANNYPQDIIEKFKEAAYTLRRAAEMTHRVDYLVSGDDGEDSFRERWKEEVRPPWVEKIA